MPPKQSKDPIAEARKKLASLEAAAKKTTAKKPQGLKALAEARKKELEAAKKREEKMLEELVTKPKAKRPRVPPNAATVARNKKESAGLRKILEKTSDDALLVTLDMLSKEPNAPYARRILLQRILKELPEDIIVELISEFLEQTDQNLDSFYAEFLKKPSVQAAIRIKMSDLDMEWADTKRRQEEQKRMKSLIKLMAEEGDIVEEEDEEEIVTARQSIKKKRERPPSEDFRGKFLPGLRPGPYRSCLEMYKKPPWVEAMVKGVYIRPTTSKLGHLLPYVIQKITVPHEGENWYKVSDLYFNLRCRTGKAIGQNGDVFSISDKKGNVLEMKIGYDTNRGFIVQDPDLYAKESEHTQELKRTLAEKYKLLLKSPVTELSKTVAKGMLSEHLLKVAPKIKDYKEDSKFISDVVNLLSEEDNEKLALGIANIVVYLPRITEENESNYVKEIKKGAYTPDILVSIPPSQKMPEDVTENEDIDPELIITIEDTIADEANDFINTFSHRLYNAQTEDRIPTVPEIKYPKKVFTTGAKKKIYRNSGEKYLVYYLRDLLPRFQEGNFKLPDNEKIKFTKIQIKKILDNYEYVDEFQEVEDEDEDVKEADAVSRKRSFSSPPLPELAPGLIRILREGVKKMRREGSRSSSDSSDRSTPSMSFSEEKLTLDAESVTSESSDSSDISTDSEASDISTDSDAVEPPLICHQCGGPEPAKNCFKTVHLDKKGDRVDISYCSYGCATKAKFPPKIDTPGTITNVSKVHSKDKPKK